ncbi:MULTISPECIES: hypothetical protein [Niastella]|uniref:Uncharacterized protein n=1 Tax=Niastella soli TaxID=2821487 RepID=A0ABS3Z1E7_9BACT|nr:hypothetical protein [Niastella soli]MBO9203991.1 hypothetical protein [Niastella soli]
MANYEYILDKSLTPDSFLFITHNTNRHNSNTIKDPPHRNPRIIFVL